MTPYGTPASNKCPPHVISCKPGEYISREAWGAVGGLTLTQQRSHFSLWVMLSSPLILGNDPRLLRSNVRDMLTAPEVLAIHADALGRQAQRILKDGPLQLWRRELSGSSRFALLVLNTKDKAIDVTDVFFQQHFADMHTAWARNVTSLQLLQLPPCKDEDARCSQWAADGECSKNPGFMMSSCKKSCPKACAEHSALASSGLAASALVRDAWEREDLGLAVGRLQVKHLEPYEGRLFVLQFVDPLGLGAGVGGLQSLVGGGISGTAGYTRPTTSARSSSSSAAASGGAQLGVAAARQGAGAAAVPGSTAESAAGLQGKLHDCQQRVVQLTAKTQQLQQANRAAAGAAVLTMSGAATQGSRGDGSWATFGLQDTGSSSQQAGGVGGTAAEHVDQHQVQQQHQQHRLAGSKWLSALAVNVCVLCLGFVLGMAVNRHRGLRHGLGGLHKQHQQQHSLKLY
jgi:alpha-galactosidase